MFQLILLSLHSSFVGLAVPAVLAAATEVLLRLVPHRPIYSYYGYSHRVFVGVRIRHRNSITITVIPVHVFI